MEAISENVKRINWHERRVIDRLSAVRRHRKVTLQQLAADTGVPFRTISRIERGNRHLRAGEAVVLCEALGVTMAEVVSDEPLVLV